MALPGGKDANLTGHDATSDPAAYDLSPAHLQVLMDTFWTAGGWRDHPLWPARDAMDAAVEAGIMFRPRTSDHDRRVAAARAAAASLTAGDVGEAFLASLTSRRLDLRSALGSYAVARFLPAHTQDYSPGWCCAICGLRPSAGQEPTDLNVLSFERFKWGGVRTDQVEYVAFDLEQFARAPRLRPTGDDIRLGQQLIDQLRDLPPGTTAADAARYLAMLPGNKAERDTVIGILGVCGILQTAAHPGCTNGFVTQQNRELPSRRHVDRYYPACRWTADDGVNDAALRIFLPQLT
jgi:hypothetical protein